MPAHIREVKWGEDNPIESAPVLTDEEKHIIEQKIAALDKLLATEKKAKYKIELLFGKARSTSRPTPGALSFWESGTKFHGGGDAKIYLCPAKSLGKSACEAFIPDASTGYGHLVCPKCGSVWQGKEVIGEIFANLPMKKWGEVLLKYYVRLELNCDIYLKYARDDIRAAAAAEKLKHFAGEQVNLVRSKRAMSIYPLRNILKDSSAGADLLSRFQAFLLA